MKENDLIKKQEKQIDTLVGQALNKTNPYSYGGISWSDLQRYNEYKEEGLELTKDDMSLTQIYAGLTVLSKEIYEDDLSKQPEIIKNTMHEAIRWDKKKYPLTAFPYDSEEFPYPKDLNIINNVIEKIKKQSSPSLKFLDENKIRHEWTVKVGKKILMILIKNIEMDPVLIVGDAVKQKFKSFICGKNGINNKLKKGGDEAELVKSLATYLLPAIGVASASAAPFVVLVSVILIKSYLKTYCQ